MRCWHSCVIGAHTEQTSLIDKPPGATYLLGVMLSNFRVILAMVVGAIVGALCAAYTPLFSQCHTDECDLTRIVGHVVGGMVILGALACLGVLVERAGAPAAHAVPVPNEKRPVDHSTGR